MSFKELMLRGISRFFSLLSRWCFFSDQLQSCTKGWALTELADVVCVANFDGVADVEGFTDGAVIGGNSCDLAPS